MDLDTEEKLIKDNQPLVAKIVRGFKPKSSDYEDFIAVGNIGLLNAIRKHNPSRGRLSTLAWCCITREIIQSFRNNINYSNRPFDVIAPTQESLSAYIPNTLSHIEKDIIRLKLDGHSLREIGTKLGKKTAYITRHFKKAVNKIKLANE